MHAKHVIEVHPLERTETLNRLDRALELTQKLLDEGQEKDNHNEILGVRMTLKDLREVFK